jgi:hypothetical protein
VSVDHPADETAQWVILDTFRTEVASGRIRAESSTSDRFSANLPGAGRYQYLLYVNGTGDVLESFTFAVRACPGAGLADTGLSGGALAGVLLGLLLLTTGMCLGLFRLRSDEEVGHASCFPSLPNRAVR